jgi:hypothetical protein
MRPQHVQDFLWSHTDAKTTRHIPPHILRYTLEHNGNVWVVTNTVLNVTTKVNTTSPVQALTNHIEDLDTELIELQIENGKAWRRLEQLFSWYLPSSLYYRLTKDTRQPNLTELDILLYVFFNQLDGDTWKDLMPFGLELIDKYAKALFDADGPHTFTNSDDSYSRFTDTYAWGEHRVEEYREKARENLMPDRFKNESKNTKLIHILLEWAQEYPQDFETLKSYFKTRKEDREKINQQHVLSR